MKLRLGLLRGRAHPHGLSRIKPGGSIAGFGPPLPHAPAGARPAANRIERRIASVTALAKGKAAAPSSQGAMPPFTGDDVPGRRACPEVDRVRRQRSLPPRKNRDRTDCLHAEGM